MCTNVYSFYFLFVQALRLDNNRLTDINGLLTTQNHLQWLNVSYNAIQWFDYAFVPKSVLWLNMRANAIEELGNYYEMRTGFHLVHLDIGQNKLMRLDKQALQSSLREVCFTTFYAHYIMILSRVLYMIMWNFAVQFIIQSYFFLRAACTKT